MYELFIHTNIIFKTSEIIEILENYLLLQNTHIYIEIYFLQILESIILLMILAFLSLFIDIIENFNYEFLKII